MEHIFVAVEPSTSDYTTFVAQIVVLVAAAQTISTVVLVQIEVEVVFVPPAVATAAPLDDPLASHNTSHIFSPGVGRMHDNLYLHARWIDKMRSIGLSAS